MAIRLWLSGGISLSKFTRSVNRKGYMVMNNLSWMIYLADVVGTIRPSFAFYAIAGSTVALLCLFFGSIPASYDRWDSQGHIERSEDHYLFENYRKNVVKMGRLMLMVSIPLGLIALVTPSSTTVYLIAASQAGETIVTDPEMKGIFNDLKTIIKSKIKEQLPKQDSN